MIAYFFIDVIIFHDFFIVFDILLFHVINCFYYFFINLPKWKTIKFVLAFALLLQKNYPSKHLLSHYRKNI